MKNIRTILDLSDWLSEEKAWRRKELHELRSLILTRSFTTGKRDALLRGGVAMLYAHWEGFVKSAASAYLEFIAMQKLPNKELAKNFLAISARKVLRNASESNKISFHIAVTNFFINEMEASSKLPVEYSINTNSNLSSEVLKEIVETLGLDYTFFETRENLINENLLKSRNIIAHGSHLIIDEQGYIDLYDKILEMIDKFSDQIENSVALKKYKAT